MIVDAARWVTGDWVNEVDDSPATFIPRLLEECEDALVIDAARWVTGENICHRGSAGGAHGYDG